MSEEKTLKQQIAEAFSPEMAETISLLIDKEIIGNYELCPIPDFTSPRDVGKWTEEQELIATRNGLRKEQRIRLWGKEQARLHAKYGEEQE